MLKSLLLEFLSLNSSKGYFIFNFYILYRYFESQTPYKLGFRFI